MTEIRNTARERLSQGAVSPGIGVRGVRHPEIARVMKTAGFDWLFIDLEHGSTSIETACAICVSALDAGISPLVRVTAGALSTAARCLDGGALGIVVPHVDTPEQAAEMVDALRFAPLGHRSVAGGYPQFGFAAVPVREAVERLNATTILVAMIETPRAVENAERIAATPGIDALLIGTNDLCLELGMPGRLDAPEVSAAVERVVSACKKYGKWAGQGGVYQRELMQRYIEMGMRMILSGNDTSLLLGAAQNQAAFVRSCAGQT